MQNPFRKESLIAKVFEMAAKGTTRTAIDSFCEKNKVGASRMFHCLRRGTYGEAKWGYQQSEDGKVKLVAKASAKKAVKKAGPKPVATEQKAPA